MTLMMYALCALISYLLGSIPTGYLWGRARGIDIRKVGSGNIGATNVMRALGRLPGIMVLALDALKGFLPVAVAPLMFTKLDAATLHIVCCVSVIAGHNWTCWLGFKGGKGIATSAGALLAFLPHPLVMAVAVWGIVFLLSRYVSLASICAALVLPVGAWWFTRENLLTGFAGVLAAVAIVKHRSNIQRLLAGTENRIGARKPSAQPNGGPVA